MRNRNSLLVLIAAGVFGVACSQQDAGEPAEPAVDGAASEPKVAESPVSMPRTQSPADARVFFITPADGDTVSSPFRIDFGLEGMSVVKAGDDSPKSGHHHLLIDTALPDLGLPIPADEQHVHFGDGSTSTEVTLPAGKHTLRLLLGDHLHIPHDPPVMSDTITVTVE